MDNRAVRSARFLRRGRGPLDAVGGAVEFCEGNIAEDFIRGRTPSKAGNTTLYRTLVYVGSFRTPKSECPTVVLKSAREPDRAMAIGISKETAVSILAADGPVVCEGGPVRPTVHDAFAGLSERAEVKFERAVIDRLDGRGVFAASLFGYLPGGVSFDPIDVRGSDAVALALRTGGSLEVTPDVRGRSERYDVGSLPFTALEVRDLLPL